VGIRSDDDVEVISDNVYRHVVRAYPEVPSPTASARRRPEPGGSIPRAKPVDGTARYRNYGIHLNASSSAVSVRSTSASVL